MRGLSWTLLSLLFYFLFFNSIHVMHFHFSYPCQLLYNVFFFCICPKELENLVEKCMVKWKGMQSIPSGICKTWEKKAFWITHCQTHSVHQRMLDLPSIVPYLITLSAYRIVLLFSPTIHRLLQTLVTSTWSGRFIVTCQFILVVTSCILQLLLGSFGREWVFYVLFQTVKFSGYLLLVLLAWSIQLFCLLHEQVHRMFSTEWAGMIFWRQVTSPCGGGCQSSKHTRILHFSQSGNCGVI